MVPRHRRDTGRNRISAWRLGVHDMAGCRRPPPAPLFYTDTDTRHGPHSSRAGYRCCTSCATTCAICRCVSCSSRCRGDCCSSCAPCHCHDSAVQPSPSHSLSPCPNRRSSIRPRPQQQPCSRCEGGARQWRRACYCSGWHRCSSSSGYSTSKEGLLLYPVV